MNVIEGWVIAISKLVTLHLVCIVYMKDTKGHDFSILD
jgi:hypothetical protein